jgi:hypothetical protein
MVSKAMTKPPPEERTDSTIEALGAPDTAAKSPEPFELWIVWSMVDAIVRSPNWVKYHRESVPRV